MKFFIRRSRASRPGGALAGLWHSLAFALLAAALALAGQSAHAQAIDEVRLVNDGPDAVLQIRFSVRVQYQRHAPLEASDVIEIYFQLLGGDEALTRPIEESVAVKGQDPAPGARVVYPVQSGLPVKKVVVRLDRKVDFRVRAGKSNQLLEVIMPGLAGKSAEAALQAAAPAPSVVEPNRYAISLETVPLAQQGTTRAIPARLQDYAVFGSQGMRNGAPVYELVLGYFDSREAAQKVLDSLAGDFPGAQVFDVVQRKEANLQSAAQLPAASAETPPPAAMAPPETERPSGAAAAAAAAAAAPDTDLDRQGAALMSQSRAALVGGKNDEAINTLNQLLLLPPNKYSQDAQELVGLARERSGDLAQARKEYELYLRLFPTGDGATRVRQRLATLAPPEQAVAAAAKPPEKRQPQLTAGGSVSQFYYGGNQTVQTTFNAILNVPQTANQPTLSTNTQSSLVSTVDLNGRYRTDTTDTRIVVRDSDQYSFISSTSPSINRMDSAYVDYRDMQHGLSVKAGRQSGVTGGLVGRFDGAIVSYDLRPKLRINAVAGVPVGQDQFVKANQRFEGLSIDAQNFAEHWGASGFVINQTADSVIDRRAVGGEVRYFDEQKTLYSLVDYDVEFRTINAATLQGTYQFPDQTSVSLLADARKAPTLETTNGLLQAGCPSPPSYADYFAGKCSKANSPYTDAQLRQDALFTTANARQFALDASRPLGKHWQISGDLRVTSVGALPTLVIGNQTFQGSSATGNVYAGTLQATGSNLYSKRDINVFSITHLHSATLDGDQLSFSNLNTVLDNRVSLEPNLSLYREVDTTGQRLLRIAPSFRTSYKLSRRISLEGTVAMERSRNEGPTQNDTTSNVFYYLGYRFDLNN